MTRIDKAPRGTLEVRIDLTLVESGGLEQLGRFETLEAVRDRGKVRKMQSRPDIVQVWGMLLWRNQSHSVSERVSVVFF